MLTLCGAAMLLALAAQEGGEPPPPAPAPPDAPAPPPDEGAPPAVVETAPPVVEEPALSPEELKAIEDSLKANAAEAGALSKAPDLSKVNLGAALPQATQSMNPDISLVLDGAVAWFSVDEPLQVGGHDPQKTGFTLQQVELTVGSSVDPFFRFDSNIVFSLFGVEVEEAYATTLALPFNLQARAGQFLTRFGRINPTHPHAWNFVDQSLVIGKMFGSEGNRGLGGELSWLAPLPWFTEVVVSTTNADGECCARSYLGADDIGIKTPLDLLVTGALKQFFPLSDDLSLMVGVSAQTGPNATGNFNRSEIYGTDLVLRYRPVASETPWSLSLEAEGLFRGRQVPFGVLYDGGGYTQLVWKLDRIWETAARYELLSGLDDDYLDAEWTTWRQRGTAQLTYYPSHFSRLRLQGSVDHPAWEAGPPIFALMLTLEVIVGAHGAHSY